MLTKETKAKAEEIKREISPLIENAKKLAKKLQQAVSDTRHADNVARAWQYPDTMGWAKDAGEDSETIQRTRNENPHEWHEILNNKYVILHECEIVEKAARLNYRNWIAFICSTLVQLLHEGDTWAMFYEKRGLETLAEEIKKETGENLYIYRDGTGWEPFGSDRFYCYLKIVFWGVCGMRANDWATYTEHAKGSNKEWQKPEQPKLYTVAQYKKLVADLKKLENKAKEIAREHHDKARQTGLVYFIGGLSDPQLSIWGKND